MIEALYSGFVTVDLADDVSSVGCDKLKTVNPGFFNKIVDIFGCNFFFPAGEAARNSDNFFVQRANGVAVSDTGRPEGVFHRNEFINFCAACKG